MNLQEQQVKALTNLLHDLINSDREQKYQTEFEQKKKELQQKFDADIQYVEACLSKCPFKVSFGVPIYSEGVFYGKGWIVDDYITKCIFPSPLYVDKFSIEQDIWLESIEATNLQSLINTIKNKYVTN